MNIFLSAFCLILAVLFISATVLTFVQTMVNKKTGKFDANEALVGIVTSLVMLMIGCIMMWVGVKIL